MQFGRFDFAILVGMSLAIIFMSFTFPALGVGGDEVNETEIPDFNITTSRFDWAGDFPERESQTQRGSLSFVANESAAEATVNRQVWLQRSGDGDDYVLSLTNLNGTNANPVPTYNLIQFSDGGLDIGNDSAEVPEGTSATLSAGDYEVFVDNTNVTKAGEPDLTITGDWEITEAPEGSGGYFSSIADLSATIAWGFSVLWWFHVAFLEFILNLLGIFLDIATFGVDTMHFLTTAYTSIINSQTTAWVKVMLSIPGILLALEFSKIAMVAIKLLPTT